jgi:hypothetical protein
MIKEGSGLTKIPSSKVSFRTTFPFWPPESLLGPKEASILKRSSFSAKAKREIPTIRIKRKICFLN